MPINNIQEKHERILHRIVMGSAYFILVISVSIAALWIGKSIWTDIEVSNLLYMKFNTAVSFMAVSTALLSTLYGRRNIAFLAGSFLLFMGGVTLLEYIIEMKLGIDELLIKDLFDSHNPYPGRMAPNTSLAFVLAGLSVILINHNSQAKIKIAIIAFLGFLIFILGDTGLLAHIQGVEVAYSWNSYTQMAPHTATSFIALGIGFLAVIWKKYGRIVLGTSLFMAGLRGFTLPLIIFTVLTTGSFFLYGNLENKELHYIKTYVEQASSKTSSLVQSQINSELLALNRMAQRWDIANGTPSDVWRSDASNYVTNLAGLKTVEWVDSSYHIRWVEPVKGNEDVIGLNILFDKEREDALKGAEEKTTPTVTAPIDLLQGYKAFISYIPLKAHNRFDGFMVGVFSINDFFSAALTSDIDTHYDVFISYNGKTYFNNKTNSALRNSEWELRKNIEIYDKTWVIHITPTKELLTLHQTHVPFMVLIAGIVISILSALSAWFMLVSRVKSKYLENSNQQINAQIQKIEETEMRHQQLVDGVQDYAIYWLDLEGNIESWNSGAENIKQYSAKEIIGRNFSTFYTKEDQENHLPQKALSIALTEGIFTDEGWRVRKDGSRLWASVTISAIHGKCGNITGFAKVTKDITKRQNFEQKLLESEKRYDLAVSGMSVGLWDWNVITNELYWSDKFKEIIGIDKNFTAHYDEFAERLHPEDKDVTVQMLFDHLDHKCPYDVEYRLRHNNGNYIWIHAYGQAEWDEEGKPIRMAGSVDDISKRKYAEEERQKLIAIIEESVDYIGVADIKGRLQYHNSSALRMIGLPENSDLSKLQISDMHPAWAVRIIMEEAIPTCFEKGSWQGETALLHRNGQEIPVLQNLSLQRDDKGTPICFTTIMRDITERKEAEQSLKISEETFRSAIENASIGMALVSKEGRFTKVNQALCNLLGYSREELLSNNFQAITNPEDLAKDMDFVEKMLAGNIKTYQMEKRYYHKTGHIIWALLSVSMVYDSEGKPDYFVSQIQDITERKEVDRIKGEFISMVSHELRTPLTSIRGSLGLILGALSTDLPEKVKGLLNIANNNSERLILLINDILDMDKIAAGQMRFDMQEESLADITQQAVEANQAYAEKFKSSIVVKVIDKEIKVEVDAARYIQILSNLLSNAAKFSPEGKEIEISATQTGSNVRIAVKDYGNGIPEAFRSRIFGKFSQADSSSARGKGGTGLGLHITKSMVEHMGGVIGFDTETNKGTTFWVEFPITENDDDEADSSGISDDNDTLPEILHIEDDTDLSQLLATALQGKATLLNATTLKKAKKLLKNKHFSTVIIDIGLPDGSGLEILDHLPDLTSSIPPVMVLSASEVPEELRNKASEIIIKSRTSETKIIEVILYLVEQYKKEHPL